MKPSGLPNEAKLASQPALQIWRFDTIPNRTTFQLHPLPVRIPARLLPEHLSKNYTISFIKLSQIYYYLVRFGLVGSILAIHEPLLGSHPISQLASQEGPQGLSAAQGRREAWRAFPHRASQLTEELPRTNIQTNLKAVVHTRSRSALPNTRSVVTLPYHSFSWTAFYYRF